MSVCRQKRYDILKVLRDEYPRLKVLIVSMYPEDQYAVRAFRAGAFGYLNKAARRRSCSKHWRKWFLGAST